MGTVTVPLSQGEVAVIDEEDLPLVAPYKWHVHRYKPGRHLTAESSQTVNGRRTTVLMHRLLLSAPRGLEVDHRDGNPLNNRRANLRFATRVQNSVNVGPRDRNSTGFKGVYWDKRKRKFVAGINYQRRHIHLGYYRRPEDAARAYDSMAQALHGEFARLNFP